MALSNMVTIKSNVIFPLTINLYVLSLMCILTSSVTSQDQQLANWPQWRGPHSTGAADGQPPIEWSETKNVQWKLAIPGKGHSTPVVWKNHLFITTALDIGEAILPRRSGRPGAHDNLAVTHKQRYIAMAIDRKKGKVLWNTTVNEKIPLEGGHDSASLASHSPATDGKYLYAFFGSAGLYCLDFHGKIMWQKNFGHMHSKHGHGEGSSPVLFQDKLFINWDHEGQSFLVALNCQSGKEIWRVNRSEVTSWATPLIINYASQQQLVVCGSNRVRAYNLETGKVIWECGGLSNNIVATPVFSNGILIAGSSYEKRAMLAIKIAGAKGDITNSDQVLWERFRGTPYVPSPLLVRGHIFFLAHYQGILSRVDIQTGEDSGGPFRLGGIRNVYASPISANGNIYVTDLDGATIVIEDSNVPNVIAYNRLDDRFAASPIAVNDELFLRGAKFLYCIARGQ